MMDKPKSLIFSNEINLDEYLIAEPRGIALPYPILDENIRGLQPAKLWTVIAGTGIGKSTLVKEIICHLLKNSDIKIADIALEESTKHTVKSYLAIDNNIPLWKLKEDPQIVLRETLDRSANALFSRGRLIMYDHFGSLEDTSLKDLLTYLAMVVRVDLIVLDHITIAISGLESSHEGERKDLDRLATFLKKLAVQANCSIIVISQLRNNKDGKAYEEGRVPNNEDIRSSGALAQLSDFIIALARNTKDSSRKSIIDMYINKNRHTGRIGLADVLYFLSDKGRLVSSNDLSKY